MKGQKAEITDRGFLSLSCTPSAGEPLRFIIPGGNIGPMGPISADSAVLLSRFSLDLASLLILSLKAALTSLPSSSEASPKEVMNSTLPLFSGLESRLLFEREDSLALRSSGFF